MPRSRSPPDGVVARYYHESLGAWSPVAPSPPETVQDDFDAEVDPNSEQIDFQGDSEQMNFQGDYDEEDDSDPESYEDDDDDSDIYCACCGVTEEMIMDETVKHIEVSRTID